VREYVRGGEGARNYVQKRERMSEITAGRERERERVPVATRSACSINSVGTQEACSSSSMRPAAIPRAKARTHSCDGTKCEAKQSFLYDALTLLTSRNC